MIVLAERDERQHAIKWTLLCIFILDYRGITTLQDLLALNQYLSHILPIDTNYSTFLRPLRSMGTVHEK